MNKRLFLIVFAATLIICLLISFTWSGDEYDKYGKSRTAYVLNFGWTENQQADREELSIVSCDAVPRENWEGYPFAYKRFMAPCAPPETEYNFIALFINLVSCAFAAFVVAATVTKIKSAVLKQS
jgi:hypothetical protein